MGTTTTCQAAQCKATTSLPSLFRSAEQGKPPKQKHPPSALAVRWGMHAV